MFRMASRLIYLAMQPAVEVGTVLVAVRLQVVAIHCLQVVAAVADMPTVAVVVVVV